MTELLKTEYTGKAVEYNGEYWGYQHGDAQYSCIEYGPIENATLSSNKFLTEPTDLTHSNKPNSDFDKLEKGRLVEIKITTTYESVE